MDLSSRFTAPLVIMSALIGMFGGVRAQYHLRQVCVALNLIPLNSPEVFIMQASTKFSDDGKLTDEYYRASISKLMQALVDIIRGIK